VVSGNDGYGPSFLEEPEFERRMAFIVDFPVDKIMLGVCRWAQAQALQQGAKFDNLEIPERSPTSTVVVDGDDELMRGMPARFLIHADHRQRLDSASLPLNYKVIASSPNCRVSVVRIVGTKHWLSQNHLEFGKYTAKQMLRNLLDV